MLVPALLLAGALLAPGAAPAAELWLATTTSVRDSGLLAELLPDFERRSGLEVKVLAVGSGAALRLGAEGNADVLLTHAPEAEEELLRSGRLLSREPFMENFFVIAGPAEDPAGVARAESAAEAMRRIVVSGHPFASRGDESGTHQREQALLRAAGLDPNARWPGRLGTGASMGETLLVAGEKRAYVLSDLGSFLAFERRSDLVALSQPDASLRNVYSVLVVRPVGRPLADYLLEEATQRRIGAFGSGRHGRALFTPLRLPAVGAGR